MKIQDSLYSRLRRLNQSDYTVSVQSVAAVDTTTARALVQYAGPDNHRDLEAAVANTWGKKVRLAAQASFHIQERNGGISLIDTVLKLNVPSIAFSEDTMKERGMSVVVANVFRDKDDNVWKVTGTDDHRMLVQVAKEDMADVLQSRRSMSIATASVGYSLSEHFVGGDAVLAYDMVKEERVFGIALDEKRVFVPGKTAVIAAVDPVEVLAVYSDSASPAGFDKSQVAEVATDANGEPLTRDNMMQRHLNYMGKLYNTNGEYYQKLRDLINSAFNKRAIA